MRILKNMANLTQWRQQRAGIDTESDEGVEEFDQLVQGRLANHLAQILLRQTRSLLQQPRQVRVALESQELGLCTANAFIAAVRTSQMQQRTLENPHRQVVRMLAELQDPEVDQKLADVQTCLENSERSDIGFSFKNVVNGQQHDFVIDAALFGDVERRSRHFCFIQAAVHNVRVCLRTQQLGFEDAGGASVYADCIELRVD